MFLQEDGNHLQVMQTGAVKRFSLPKIKHAPLTKSDISWIMKQPELNTAR